MTLSIRGKLLLGGGAVLAIFAIATCVAYQQSRIVSGHLAHVTGVAMPLREAALEMHAGFLASGLSAIGYLQDRNPLHIARLSEDNDSFSAYMGHYTALANTPRLQELAGMAKKIFARFRELTQELMQRKDALSQKTAATHDAFIALGRLFESRTRPGSHTGVAPGNERAEIDMQITLGLALLESSYWSLIANSDSTAEMRVREAAGTLTRHRDRYQRLPQSPQEKEWLAEVDRHLSVIRSNLDESIILAASMRQAVEEFMKTRHAMSEILVSGIQTAVSTDVNEAQKQRSAAIAWMNALLIALLMSGLSVGTIVGVAIYRGVTRPIERLNSVTQALARGEAVSLERQSDQGEFGTLMRSFRQMVTARAAAEDGIRELNSGLERRNAEAAHAMNMSNLLQIAVDMDEAGEILARAMQQLLSPHSGALYLTASSLNRLDRLTSWGSADHPYAQAMNPEECWGLRRSTVYAASNQLTDMYCHHVHRESTGQSYVCVPMMAHGMSLGLLHVCFDPATESSLEEERHRVERLANQIALALSNLKLRQRLREQSIRDTLTGLYNRRHLEESLEREVAGAIRDKRPFAVFMLDVDHFKRFNDQFGHEGGDAVLQTLGRTLKESARKSDLVARYGGEEFTVLLPNTPLAGAVEWGERMRDAVTRMKVNAAGQQLPPITVSLGLAVFPEHGHSSQVLLREADTALYEAKSSGRNRLVVRSRHAAAEDQDSDGVVIALPRHS